MLFGSIAINDYFLVLTVALFSLGTMGYLTYWLVRKKTARSFLAFVWTGFLIIFATGGLTISFSIHKEQQHWSRFFTSTVKLFASLVQSTEHEQIEFSYSLWSDPYHPENLPLKTDPPQPDPKYSNRFLDVPPNLQLVHEESDLTHFKFQWQPVPSANTYELERLENLDGKVDWTVIYHGSDTNFTFDKTGWFRVRSLFITPPDDPVYQKISQLLIEVAKTIPDIGSVYTLRDYSDDDYVFLVCPEMDANKDGVIDPESERLAPIGEVYTHENSMLIPPDERSPRITPEPVTDEWGTWFSAVIPIYRPDGTRDGYVSVDYPVATWRKNMHWSQLAYTFFLIVVFAMFVFGVVQMTLLHIAALEQREMMNNLHNVVAELTEAKKMTEIAARAKSHFLTNMSHEIRTPMNAVIGFADILGRRLLECCRSEQLDDNKETINLIEKSGSDLLTIINDILDFSKVDADQIEIEWIPTNPRQIMDDVRNVMLPRLAAKPQLHFKLEIAEDVPQWIFSDPTRLRQILENICGNAIKFSELGTIWFYCCFMKFDCTEENVQKIKQMYGQKVNTDTFMPDSSITLLQFLVQDEGIGIPLEYVSTLFQPFVQADSSLTRKFGGTGLGLSISKRLTELMGGDITVQSEENKGSVFRVTFAVKEMTKREATYSGIILLNDFEKPLTGMSVLVVEDGKINQIVITKMLQDAGAIVQIAENGKLGIDAVEAPDAFFDIILMDMQMPVMDGYEATFRLRQNGFKKPIIAVTAHALSGDCEKTLQVGCNAYLSKPVDRNKLIDLLLRFDQASLSLQ